MDDSGATGPELPPLDQFWPQREVKIRRLNLPSAAPASPISGGSEDKVVDRAVALTTDSPIPNTLFRNEWATVRPGPRQKHARKGLCPKALARD